MSKILIVLLFLSLYLFANMPEKVRAHRLSNDKIININADNKSYVDCITINDREFDELPSEVEFYEEDLQNGKIVVQGILESEDKNTPIEFLHVEITTDGGENWSKAKGNREWEWSFTPELEKSYEFSLRVMQEKKFDKQIIKKNRKKLIKEHPKELEKKGFISRKVRTNLFERTNNIIKVDTSKKEENLYAVDYKTTILVIEFKLKKPTLYKTTIPVIEFKLKKPTLYKTTIPVIEFKLKKPTLYKTTTPVIEFKLK